MLDLTPFLAARRERFRKLRPPTPGEMAAARRSLRRHPDRDAMWAEAVLDALEQAGLKIEDLACRHGAPRSELGVPVTDYCMTGCPTNALRRLMAQGFCFSIPGLWLERGQCPLCRGDEVQDADGIWHSASCEFR